MPRSSISERGVSATVADGSIGRPDRSGSAVSKSTCHERLRSESGTLKSSRSHQALTISRNGSSVRERSPVSPLIAAVSALENPACRCRCRRRSARQGLLASDGFGPLGNLLHSAVTRPHRHRAGDEGSGRAASAVRGAHRPLRTPLCCRWRAFGAAGRLRRRGWCGRGWRAHAPPEDVKRPALVEQDDRQGQHGDDRHHDQRVVA